MKLPAYKFQKGILHSAIPVFILAISVAVIFGFLQLGERSVATSNPVGELSASSDKVNLDDPNASITFKATGVQGANGAEPVRLKYFVVNPKLVGNQLSRRFAWSSPDWCTEGNPPCDSNSEDADGDGFNNDVEIFIGTDPNAACPTDTSHDAYPPDVNNDGVVDLSNDLLGIILKNGSGDPRYDMNADGKVDEADYWVAKALYRPSDICEYDTTGILENDEIFNIGIDYTPGTTSELIWDKNTQLSSVGYDRFLSGQYLEPGFYTIGLFVKDANGNVNKGASFITIELGNFGVPEGEPEPSGLDIIGDPGDDPLPSPSPTPSPIPSPAPLPIPDDLVVGTQKTYQYWVHVWGVIDSEGIRSYTGRSRANIGNNPILSTDTQMGFDLTVNPDPRGYELLVCSPDCSGGFESVTYKGSIVFYPHSSLGAVNVTPDGPITVLGIDTDKDGFSDEQEIFISMTDPQDSCSLPPDMNGDGSVDLFNDLLFFWTNFSFSDSKFDVNADGSTDLRDWVSMPTYNGYNCHK